MTTDTIIYIICGAMVLVAVAFPFINIMFRRTRTREGKNSTHPSFSIIIPANDNAADLEKHLPRFLSQQYDGDFEIIVVDSKTGDHTDEVLAKLSDDKRLYSTFIPSSSRYMSRKKLALTIGAKAAKHEWIIFVDAECYPATDRWLNALAKEINGNSTIAIGYGNYNEETSHFHRYIHLINSMYAIRKADKGRAHMSASDFIGIKRNIFMDAKGFDGNLMYVRGEYDYLVNKFAEKGNTAVITSPEGWMMREEPTIKEWKNENLFRVDTMKHLEHRICYALAPTADQTALLAAYFMFIGGITAGILLNDILLTVVSALSLIIGITERILLARKTLIMYDTEIPLWKIFPFEIMILMHNIKYKLKYRFSDKLDFVSHKL